CRRAVAGGPFCCGWRVGKKRPETRLAKKQNGPSFPARRFPALVPFRTGSRNHQRYYFYRCCSTCNRCRDEAASQLYPGQVVEVAALSSLHGVHCARGARGRESAVV